MTPGPNSSLHEDPESDRSLLARWRERDEAAASTLYARYSQRLLELAHHRTSPALRQLAPAEDVVQSVFRSLFRGVDSGAFDAPEGASLWNLLAVIAINKIRRKASRSRSVAAGSLEAAPDDRGELDIPGADSPEQVECALRETIEGLLPLEQELVLLRIEGYSVVEISDRLGRSTRTVERSLQRLRDRLSDELLQ